MSDQLLSSSAEVPEVPERFDPATMQGEIISAEHLARYRWAAPLALGRRVLDAGCGTAYGSMLLAEAGASEVIGVDRAPEVLDSVRAQMPDTVLLEEGDVTSLPYQDGRFDLVVCFEVIEHLDDPGRALDEFRRVLSPEGILAVSSPNRDVYPPGNPHHVHEFTPPELQEELSRRFAFVKLDRQHTWITSGVLDDARYRIGDDGDLGAPLSIHKLDSGEPGAELYTVGLAAQRELPGTAAIFELASPVELRKWDDLWHQQAKLLFDHERAFADNAAYQAQLQVEIHELRGQLARAEAELARMPALDAQMGELVQVNDGLLQLNNELAQRQVAFEELADRYTVLVESTSWKLTRPLRRVVAFARKLAS